MASDQATAETARHAATNGAFEAGLSNCVENCADVKPGQSVYVVSEEGVADCELVDAVADRARARGAKVTVVWGPEIPRDRRDEIPADVLAAYANADVLFAHYPTLKREALHPHFPGERRVRVPNRARTVELMSSDWAAFPFSVQRSMILAIDGLSAPGRSWRITSPAGTDVRGRFGDPNSTMAEAYFVEEEDGRARRNFPGGVHSPVMAVETEGIIVGDHVARFGEMSRTDPLVVEIREGRVVSVKGGDEEGRMAAAVQATNGFIDSWHAGVNPRTVVPIERRADPVEWYTYSHCSPMIVHFHVGRCHDPIDVACFNQTVTVDSTVLYDQGRLDIWDHPDVDRAVARSGMAASMLENSDIPLV